MFGVVGTDQLGTGVITGAPLEAPENQDRLKLLLTEPPTLHAEFTATLSDVNGSVQLGELAAAGIENGNGVITGFVDISIVPPAGKDFITLADLIGVLNNPGELIDITADLDASFGADLFVDLAGLNVQEEDPNLQPRIEFNWPNIVTTDPALRVQTDTLSFTTPNIERLLQFDGITVSQIVEVIRRLVDLVDRMTEGDLLGTQLPLVNASLADVLNGAAEVATLIDRILENPQVGLNELEGEIESLLGLADNQFELVYDDISNAIRVELNLLLDPDAYNAALNLDLADAGLDNLAGLVDFQATGAIGIDAMAELRLHLGLDLDAFRIGRDDPDMTDDDALDGAVFVYGSSGIFTDFFVAANNLQFTTTIASLGVDVGPGQVRLDADGLAFGRPNNNDRATFNVALDDPDGVY